MPSLRSITTPLKAFVCGLFALLVVLQTLSMPGQFAHMADEHPEDAHLRWPLTIVAFLVLLCAEVVLVSTLKLLTLVEDDRIFSDTAFAWVDRIVGSIAAAWLVLAGVFVYFAPRWDDPAPPLIMILVLLGGAVFGLLMVVMRALLRQATTLRTDMDAVI